MSTILTLVVKIYIISLSNYVHQDISILDPSNHYLDSQTLDTLSILMVRKNCQWLKREGFQCKKLVKC